MAHELATTNGKAAMMYVGETPWHRLGTKLYNPATAAEAIIAAGLDYDVTLTALTTIHGTPVPKRRAVVRTDSNQVLGVVSPSYTPIQNRACFNFLDEVVENHLGRVKRRHRIRRSPPIFPCRQRCRAAPPPAHS